jgi:Tfp pilus assembly protein PilN
MDDLSRYLKPVARHMWAWWLAAIVLFAGAAWGAIEAHRLYLLSQVQAERLDALQRASRVPPPAKPTRAELEAERHWTALQQERSFSWYPVFAALENTSSTEIALLEFIPDKTARTLILRGSSRDFDSLTAYLGALAQEPLFHEVYLAHQKNLKQGNLTVIGFEIHMRLRR